MSIASMIGQLVEIFRGWTPPTPTPTPTPDPYVLPPATAETLGGVKVGDGLEVTEDGTLSATVVSDDTFVVKLSTTGSTITPSGVINAPCTIDEFKERVSNFGKPYTVVVKLYDPNEDRLVGSNLAYACSLMDVLGREILGFVTSDDAEAFGISYEGEEFVFDTFQNLVPDSPD